MKNLGTKRLETDRLILRKWNIDDVEQAYNNWATDIEMHKYVNWPIHRSIDETQTLITSWIKEYDEGLYNWVVELKDNHEIIGNIAVGKVNKQNNLCDLGYCYGSKYWGNGYATEALKAVLKYMLNDCEFHLVEARHYETNPASGKVMGKAGMKKEAILRERRKNKNTGNFDNLVVYSIVKEDL